MRLSTPTYSKIQFGILISLITWMGLMATDIYTPSMPAVTLSLQTSAHTVQLTITLFLISAGLSQLIYGPLSDHWGRRPLLIGGIGIYALGSLICTLAPRIEWLLLGRFVQGMGTGAIMSLNRVMVRDAFQGSQLAKAMSYIGGFIALAPALAPALGGFIQSHSNWRWVFAFLLIFSAIMIIVCWFTLPETHQTRNLDSPSFKKFIINYIFILKDQNFWANVICSGFAFAAMLSCATINPFIIENTLNYSAAFYGTLAMISAIGFFVGMMTNAHIVNRLGFERTLMLGNSIILAMGLIFIICGAFKIINIPAIILPTIGIEFGIALVFPNAFIGAIAPFSAIAGAAGAMYGFLQVTLSFLISIAVALIGETDQLPLGVLLFVIALLSLIIHKWLSKPMVSPPADLSILKE